MKSVCLLLSSLISCVFGEILTDVPYHMQSYNASTIVVANEDTSHYGTRNCWTAASNTNGAAVTLQKCAGAASQSWVFSAGAPNDEGAGGVGTIKVYGNKCLDVTNGVNQLGTKLQIWTCSAGNKNQRWQITTEDRGLSLVQWANTTKCMDLTGGSQTNGTPLQIWTCSSTNNNQKWAQQYAGTSPPSELSTIWLRSHISPPTQRDLCMSVRSQANNAPVIMDYCDTAGENINWFWEDGSLKFFQTFCLDVTNGVNKDGTKLQIYGCNKGNRNQQWQFNSNSSIQWVGHDKCIDLTDGKLSAGNQLQVYSCFQNNQNQQWDIIPVLFD